MSVHQVKAHPVDAIQITGVSPLRIGGDRVASPDAGVVLHLENATKHKWIIEDNIVPLVGAWLVHDADLHVRYVVAAEKFADLFIVVNE